MYAKAQYTTFHPLPTVIFPRSENCGPERVKTRVNEILNIAHRIATARVQSLTNGDILVIFKLACFDAVLHSIKLQSKINSEKRLKKPPLRNALTKRLKAKIFDD